VAARAPDSDRDWERWGEIDPLWSVASWPGKEAGGAAPWTDEEFYATGKEDWSLYLQCWERYGLDRDSCVEIGCGAGRLTRQLATTFRTTWALDVSDKMLAYARERVKDASVSFVRVSGGSIPLPDASASAVFSTFVFQHFDSLAHGAAYFQEIARVLRPGGSTLIHLPMHSWPWDRPGFELLHRLFCAIDDARAWVRRQLAPLGARPAMRGLSYPVPWLFEKLRAAGLADIELSWQPDGHQLVLARKLKPPAAGGASAR
jgi:SAM-dependent methyltransferase